jgi:hypothetical protein
MNTSEYLEAVKTHLLTNPLAENFQIIRERCTHTDCHIRAKLYLPEGRILEFSEYVQRTIHGEISVITYSYHCSDRFGNLIVRWDNTPHFPDMENFPHHIHMGTPEKVIPGRTTSIFQVFDEIKKYL